MTANVAIAGGGASGVLLATHLLRESPDVRVTMFEPGELGLGVAYATTCPAHQLNVPAARMSAFPDEPSHFVSFLEARYPNRYSARSFVPRFVYGDYLRDLASKLFAYGERFEHWRALLEERPRGADVLVLATGNAAPAPWRDAPRSARYFASAWEAGALVPGDPGERVLILGTGLSAVDAVLGLRHNGHRGEIYLLSRRGLLPHEHRLLDAPLDDETQASRTLEDLVRTMRTRAVKNWRAAIDDVRPRTNEIWNAMSYAERRRFLRHVIPYWNVHRHRMAPEAANAIAELLASGTIATLNGRTRGFEEIPGGLRVRWIDRSSQSERTLDVARAINCSGPEHNAAKLSNPLMRALIVQGVVVPSTLNVGIEVAPDGALIDMNGLPSTSVFAIGPVRFGTLIETTAIPEIRTQAQQLARTIAARCVNALV